MLAADPCPGNPRIMQRSWLRDDGLSIVLFGLFLLFLAG
jgi:hypothetical protein